MGLEQDSLLAYQSNTTIYSHALLKMHVIGGQRLVKTAPPCLFITVVQQPRIPVLLLNWSATLRVSSGCAGPPSPMASVLCCGPGLWSPPSGLSGGSPMHGLLLPSSCIPFSQASLCSFNLVSSLQLVSPMYTWPQLQGMQYTILDCLPRGNVSFALVNIECCDEQAWSDEEAWRDEQSLLTFT